MVGLAEDFDSPAFTIGGFGHLTIQGPSGQVLADGLSDAQRFTVPAGTTSIIATFDEDHLDGTPSCTRVLQAEVTGVLSRALVNVIAFRSGEINFFTRGSDDDQQCPLTLAPQAVQVQIRAGDQAVSATTPDPCRPFSGGGTRPGFAVTKETLTNLATFEARWNRSGLHHLEYIIRVGGEVSERRRFTVRATVRRTPARRIVQGEDAFVNYCINGNRLIRSRGGVLYCTRPEIVRRRYALDVAGITERP